MSASGLISREWTLSQTLAGSSRATPLGYQPLIRLCNIAADGALDCEGATGYRCVKW